MGITRIQTSKNEGGGITSLVVTMGSSPVNGNAMVLVIGLTAGTVTGISQTGATWVNAAQQSNGPGNCEIWYALSVSGAGTAITISMSLTNSPAAIAAEYSALITSGSLDKTATTTGNSTALTTGTTATTTQPFELLVGTGSISGSVGSHSTPLNSFVIVDQLQSSGSSGTGSSVPFLEKLVSATGAASSGTTFSGSATLWAGAIATFIASTKSQQRTLTGVGG